MSNIPPTVLDVFNELKTEIIWLHARWQIYEQLYGRSKKRIDLLNEAASFFFYVVQDVLLGEAQISLSKLADPAQSRSHDNLSLEQLHARVIAVGPPTLAAALRQILDRLKAKCTPFRLRRNKRLAHLDLTTAMQPSLNPLPGISVQMINEALEDVRAYVNEIERHFDDSETAYEHFGTHSDADALLEWVKRGLRYEELERSGAIHWGDYRQSGRHDA